jgi:hypothetical protein
MGACGGLVGCLGWFRTEDRGWAPLLSDFLGRRRRFLDLGSVDGVAELSYVWFLSLLLRTVRTRPVRVGNDAAPKGKQSTLDSLSQILPG